MKINTIILNNIKSFKGEHQLNCSKTINILIGKNNSGKSTILNSIYALQKQAFFAKDITLGHKDGYVELVFEPEICLISGNYITMNNFEYRINLDNEIQNSYNHTRYFGSESLIPSIEPHNIVYPFTSKRKVYAYSDEINATSARNVNGNLSNLYAKVDRIMNSERQPAFDEYKTACLDILGFVISAIPKGNGKHAVLILNNYEDIDIADMGEGISNILGLIIDIIEAKNKIFIIEEPENDIHPQALKSLLSLIEKKSADNQFFISTHSNIVMKYLGGLENAKIFNTKNTNADLSRSKLLLSDINEISDNSDDRRKVLEDLGYDLIDFDIWKAWLFLEESSAEVIIREYLIKWFAPGLIGKLRTFAANGFDEIEKKIEDFNKLFVFIHLEPFYKNKVWVFLDEGEKENKVIEKLKDNYFKHCWKVENFKQFDQHDFENYYPLRFKVSIDACLSIKDKKLKKQKKLELLTEVKEWIGGNEKQAKIDFEISALEVISLLKEIENEV